MLLRFFDIRKPLSRQGFLLGFLATICLFAFFVVLAENTPDTEVNFTVRLCSLVFIICFFILIAVRRLKDLGRGRWSYLIPISWLSPVIFFTILDFAAMFLMQGEDAQQRPEHTKKNTIKTNIEKLVPKGTTMERRHKRIEDYMRKRKLP